MKSSLFFIVCLSAGFMRSGAQTPTWSETVASIIFTNCSSCHHEGAIAPFSLMSYNDAVDWADDIKHQVTDRHMPPWPADPSYRHFKDEAVLSEEEIQHIVDWIDGGMPEGDPDNAPPVPEFPENGSMLEIIDYTVAIEPYTLQYNDDEYRWFTIQNPYDETIYVQAIEVEAGLPEVVHHCDISWDESGISQNYDLDDPLPGFNAETGYPNYDYYMNAWMAGGNLIRYPENWGIEVPPGAVFVLEIHYGPGAIGMTDSTKVHLQFIADPEDVRPVYASWVLNNPIAAEGQLEIPANEVVTFHQDYKLPAKRSFLTICPHMHLLGQSYKVWFEDDGDSIPLIYIPDWQFHWQKYYTFQKVQVIPKDAHIKSEGVYDNTVFNLDNPNYPPIDVYNGPTTEDEMFMTYFLWTNYQSGDEDIVLDSTILITSVDDVVDPIQPLIYPNPVKNYFYIQQNKNFLNPESIIIVNMLGETVETINVAPGFAYPFRVDAAALRPGVYLIHIVAGAEKYTGRIAKI